MPPALSNKGLATILSVASGLAWAGPTVSGPYLGDTYGPVRFRMEGERVIGSATGGPCGFAPNTDVIDVVEQGHVLAGHVLVCHQGPPGCEGLKSHPVLFIYNPEDHVLSAMIRNPEGCSSPVLKGNTLVLTSLDPKRAGGDEVEPEPEAPKPSEGGAQAPSPDGAGSAALVAQARRREPAVPPLEEGQRQLLAGNPAAAQTHFKHVLDKEPRNPAALVGLAACQLGLNDVEVALATLERARQAAPARPEVHLWLAYAHLKDRNRGKARESLRKALDLGWTPGNRPSEAVPETALREEITAVAQQRKKRAGRDSTGSGSTSP
ncbi:tetratricopeptide repeat protein [Pyxidicoccus fallax]|uniref:Tetratricopeptide repeat protein n=1 Tax=Pyxidicoccus fallax TaxID=394095 RepID=A0A848LJR8_9BACT|nr:tetratricopeptide repeat protein [Pyxidicoccus fallax]NMO17934.1 tetratricopeptide repeat protein [Pyxidicoccus fallax]NPC80051.1 tetratricopeptide repeat protein [Pyxidicoccus fallax]